MKPLNHKLIHGLLYCVLGLFPLYGNAAQEPISQREFITLPPLPSSTVPIEETPLPELHLDSIGSLSQEQGGLALNAWEGADPAHIDYLLTHLPIAPTSPLAASLKQRILLSGTTPLPGQAGQKTSLFELRLQHLALNQDHRHIEKLIQLTPSLLRKPYLGKILAMSYFLDEEYQKACALVQYHNSTEDYYFWLPAMAVCQALNKDLDRAELTIQLMEEDQVSFPSNFRIMIQHFYEKKGENFKTAKTEWQTYLQNLLQPQPASKDAYPLPAAEEIFIKPLKNKFIRKNIDKFATLPKTEQLQNAIAYSSQMAAIEAPFSKDLWYRYLRFAKSEQMEIPELLWIHLLESASDENRPGEVALLAVFILEEKKSLSTHPFLASRLIKALHQCGFTQEALQLAYDSVVIQLSPLPSPANP